MFHILHSQRIRYLTLIFWIGFTSLVYEIYGTRVLFFFFSETNWAITIGITAFLAGLAASSLIFSSFIKKDATNTFFIIWLMQILSACYGYFFLREYTYIPQVIDSLSGIVTSANAFIFLQIVFMWLFLFIPAFFIGGAFPLVTGLFLGAKEKQITHYASLVYFWDTCGAIVGGLLTGFWLIPYYGFSLTCAIVVVISLFIALFVAPKKQQKILTFVFIVAVIVSFFFGSSHEIDAYLFNSGLNARFGNVLFQKASPYGVITVGYNAAYMSKNKALFINYRDMCHSIGNFSESTIATLTAGELPAGSRVVNIGLGCGFTARSLANSDRVRKLAIIEINPVVVEASETYFKTENQDVLHNPKTTLIVANGADLARITKDKFNAIVIDIEEPTVMSSSPLFTSEYFGIVSQRLTPNGIFSLWVARGSNSFAKVLYNTLKEHFAFVYIRDFGDAYTFYASNKTYDAFQPATEDEGLQISRILETDTTEINTIDKRALAKYFNINTTFDFPKDYKDPFAR